MRDPEPTRATTRRPLRAIVLGVVIVVVAIVELLIARSAPASATSIGRVVAHMEGGSPAGSTAVTVDDGALPDGVTVFDDRYPAVTNLDADLLAALREAATDAAADGITFYVNSGWRSPAYQDRLLRDAVAEYGSESEAARWVATADTSPHVAGDAVDLGHGDAATWLARNGARYDLCRIYRNEPWHFELRPGANGAGCPRIYADPTQDPRMQR
jgi:D-alanyl-D-alanine carboxypeptidase